MNRLAAEYMGIPLRNPLIVGASHLTADMDTIGELERAGAGAIVTKSLFEEEIELEKAKAADEQEQYYYRHPEMITVGPQIEHRGPEEHLYWVEKTKKACSIPVIASLNAIDRSHWTGYAKQLAETGVDALELNVYASPRSMDDDPLDIEKRQLEDVEAVLAEVSLPVSVKLSPFYTNPLHFISRLDDAGVSGFVLFNRVFEPEIDVESQQPAYRFYLSHPEDHRLPLRYSGLLHGNIQADICSSTGIYNGGDAVKMILAGAACFQMVSALTGREPAYISEVLTGMETWMEKHGMEHLSDFRGKLSRKNSTDPWAYTRAQYIKWVMRPDEFFDRPRKV